jgi:eukaryotic-like serine/threonine-protein kinase
MRDLPRRQMAAIAGGTVLAGKYRLEYPIGSGGMGQVWRAEQVEWRAPVAVKLVDLGQFHGSASANAEHPAALHQRFLKEARSTAAIRSPHVVQILDCGVDPELALPFIVMELLEGETLAQRLKRERHLSPSITAHILTQVARALTRVHSHEMVHRDIKPSNLFLIRDDEQLVCKVLDFGIAKSRSSLSEDTLQTASGEQLGTPFYMSPEQIRGQRQIDFRTDLWAFGVIAFECLTGRRPFEGHNWGDLSLKICAEPIPVPSSVSRVPDGFDAWFRTCVARDRTSTFASEREAAEKLNEVLLGSGAVATADAGRKITRARGTGETAYALTANTAPSPPSNHVASHLLRRKLGLGLGAALVVGTLAGAGVLLERRLVWSDKASTLQRDAAPSAPNVLPAVRAPAAQAVTLPIQVATAPRTAQGPASVPAAVNTSGTEPRRRAQAVPVVRRAAPRTAAAEASVPSDAARAADAPGRTLPKDLIQDRL